MYEEAMQDKAFKNRLLKETKRQSQILKQALARVQIEFGKIKEKAGDTFLTEANPINDSHQTSVLTIEQILEKLKTGNYEGIQDIGNK